MSNTKNKKIIRYTKAPKQAIVKKGGRKLASLALVKRGRTNLQAKLHVNKGDEVVVINGDDKGKIGKILEVFPAEGRVIVEGVNIIKKHRRASGPAQEGEIVEIEAPIFASKVMLWDSSVKKASRVAHKVIDSGRKVRVYKTSQEQID
jgi:large subunit ribosomal protein L24